MAPPYEYKALKADQKEIRLIRILSREFSRSDALICRLEHVQLEIVKNTYAALSYTWGAAGITKEITILQEGRECTFLIRENLHDALSTFRLDSLDRYIWADAICINQSDDTEKSSQVQLMGEVYRNAQATLIWLGNATPESDLAFDFMRKFADEYYTSQSSWETLLDLVNTEEDASATFPCDAMVEILSRPWFSRIWVVQEVALASSAHFYCGEKSMEDAALLICAHLFYLVNESLGRKREKTEYERRLVSSLDGVFGKPAAIIWQLPGDLSRKAKPFVQWFEHCLMSERGPELALRATDPRDLIFGLIGIASDAKDAGIKADYTKSLTEVFVDVTKALLLQGNLGILGFAQHPRASMDLPSWVPDWRIIPFKQSLLYSGGDPGKSSSNLNIKGTSFEHENYRSFSVSPNTSVSIAFTDFDTLGTIMSLDVILLSHTSGFATTDIVPKGITYNNVRDLVVQMTSLIKRSNGNIYPTEESQQDAIFRTLVTDRIIQPTAGSSSCRARPSHLRPMQDIVAELIKPEPDDDAFMDAHRRNFSPGTESYDYSIRNMLSRPSYITHGGWIPFITHGGWIGLGRDALQEKDEIVVPIGGQFPLALRSDGAGRFRFIGEVYVHGIMDGEIMQMGLPVVKVDIY